MRNPFYVILLLMTCLCFSHATYAAFPACKEESNNAVVVKKQSFDDLINSTIEKYRLPVPPYRGDAENGSGVLSIVSLVLGIAGLASIIGAFAAIAPALLGVAAACGIAAIILGAMGAHRRPLRGVGIAGFVMGIIDMSILLVIGLIALLIVSLFEQ